MTIKKDIDQQSTEDAIEESGLTFTKDLFCVNRKAIDIKRRSVPVIASTAAVDGHGEVVDQNFDLERYKLNPVYIWDHNKYQQQDTEVLGHAENIRVEAAEGHPDGVLQMDLIHAEEHINPRAERILLSFEAGHQRAVSIGFRPKRIYWERENDEDIAHLDDNVLFETSATPIGSNPYALAARSMAVRRSKLLELTRSYGRKIDPALEKRIDAELKRCMLLGETRGLEPPTRPQVQVPQNINSEDHGRDLGAAKGQPQTNTSPREVVQKDASMTVEKDLKIKSLETALAAAGKRDADSIVATSAAKAAKLTVDTELSGEREKSLRLTGELEIAKSESAHRKTLMDAAETRANTAEELAAKYFGVIVDAELESLKGTKALEDELLNLKSLSVKHPEMYEEHIARIRKRKSLPFFKDDVTGEDPSDKAKTGAEGERKPSDPAATGAPRAKTMPEVIAERRASGGAVLGIMPS